MILAIITTTEIKNDSDLLLVLVVVDILCPVSDGHGCQEALQQGRHYLARTVLRQTATLLIRRGARRVCKMSRITPRLPLYGKISHRWGNACSPLFPAKHVSHAVKIAKSLRHH